VNGLRRWCTWRAITCVAVSTAACTSHYHLSAIPPVMATNCMHARIVKHGCALKHGCQLQPVLRRRQRQLRRGERDTWVMFCSRLARAMPLAPCPMRLARALLFQSRPRSARGDQKRWKQMWLYDPGHEAAQQC
jgi:hypothetical protein